MGELLCFIVSELVLRLIYVFSIFQFGVVGATLGAIAGAVIGWNNKMRFMEHVIIGIVSGTTLSYKLTKATFDHLRSDDGDSDEFGFVVHVEIWREYFVDDEHKIMVSTRDPSMKLIDHWQSLSSATH